MTWLLENPMSVLVLGGITAIVFGAIWLQTGRKIELYIMLAIIIGVALVVVAGNVWKSERQQVKTTLYQIAHDVERNDVKAVLEHLHARMSAVRQRIESEMPMYKFEEVKIKQNLEIKVFPTESPPRAVTSFNAVVVASDSSGLINGKHVPRFVNVTFLKEGDRWLISDYDHQDPREGFKKRK
jgi:Tfp pilus assembly protein PilE